MNPSVSKGTLYLIPVPIGDTASDYSIPSQVKEITSNLTHFVVENEKTARKMIRLINPSVDQSSLSLEILDKNTSALQLEQLLEPCIEGKHLGLMSEAGVPAVADPGSRLVRFAHQQNIRVVPLVGPSSILLALMAGGLNGQSFAFSGYLPIDAGAQKKSLQELERRSAQLSQTQIFMETPYRNDKLIELAIEVLHPTTLFSIACDLNSSQELIITKTVSEWKKEGLVSIHKRPAIFSLLKE